MGPTGASARHGSAQSSGTPAHDTSQSSCPAPTRGRGRPRAQGAHIPKNEATPQTPHPPKMTAAPHSPEGRLGHGTCAQEAGSTKRRRTLGPSVAPPPPTHAHTPIPPPTHTHLQPPHPPTPPHKLKAPTHAPHPTHLQPPHTHTPTAPPPPTPHPHPTHLQPPPSPVGGARGGTGLWPNVPDFPNPHPNPLCPPPPPPTHTGTMTAPLTCATVGVRGGLSQSTGPWDPGRTGFGGPGRRRRPCSPPPSAGVRICPTPNPHLLSTRPGPHKSTASGNAP